MLLLLRFYNQLIQGILRGVPRILKKLMIKRELVSPTLHLLLEIAGHRIQGCTIGVQKLAIIRELFLPVLHLLIKVTGHPLQHYLSFADWFSKI